MLVRMGRRLTNWDVLSTRLRAEGLLTSPAQAAALESKITMASAAGPITNCCDYPVIEAVDPDSTAARVRAT